MMIPCRFPILLLVGISATILGITMNAGGTGGVVVDAFCAVSSPSITARPRTVGITWSDGTNNSQSIRTVQILRGGSTIVSRNAVLLEAARKASSSALFQTIWNHPWIKAAGGWLLALYKTTRLELKSLNTNQRWILLLVFALGIQLGRSLSYFTLQRFQNAVDIPTRFFGPKAPCLTGRAVSVSDGDTLRFYHTPTLFHKSTLDKKKQKLSECTLPVRVCTIDTPETSKFGKPGQPFGEEAKQELQKLIGNRMIQIRLLSMDQYGRAVGQVFVPRRFPLIRQRLGVDEILLQAGLAEVYQGVGAVYGTKGKGEYMKLEEQARQAKKGIWSQLKRESAAEYKKRTK